MTIVLPFSTALTDLGKNFSGTHDKQLPAEFETKFVCPIRRSAEFFDDGAVTIKAGNEALDRESITLKVRLAGDRNLAASTEGTKETAFGRHGRTRRTVIQDLNSVSRRGIA